ncbi:2-hydroxy-6-oxonona-2,4-dienedioate hydrolase/4,5:9,10-diseco-3-hydroxy-5,9,17-trioxoandrosta-1(10),2-diene-4-oate hydrolase [Actinocorallia herbida]|uniref:2-hydroxy-6-oxonona-2,4-dienedioate hydrolase/4,5:9,10-diseco-3-hydroxy-5,9, 17-trioxoandrosta-1(10),2-diene-4-oate hydrolase n=1 Tax=Actinocorallia herbida TaxID=58109 RepID=A0A3N1CTR9_9ACTN|nr:alpha/beta fold hydrolase [Actinocorallia herbida]ROO84712.1 2-hydroxy-6-oxonona-2,4-dienedioate hydrolase/4,5:9,10-diseco-3-hydroxy-5,9,17-trioxoandrosta-1(10),2-diene-4-oate hydrolase [Actinocorallia herbida]
MSVIENELPITQRVVRTSLGDINVAEVGSGPVLVMLHGGGPGASGVSNYHQNLPALAARFRVVLPDQPGFGGSYRPTEADLDARSITEITVDALYQALDALGIETFHLLGNSLGGAAAIAMAQARPERVTGLVLMAPGGGWLPFGPTPTEGQKEMFRYFNGTGPSEKKMASFIRTMVFDHRQFGADVVKARYEASLDESHIAFYHRYNAAFAQRHGMDPLWRDLPEIKAPTLLLWGRDDRTITLEGAQIMLKYIRNVQLHVFGDCGHWVQLERAREFERHVADFLGDLS